MKAPYHFMIIYLALCLICPTICSITTHRRILHQPLYPASSAPPPSTESPPPPPTPPDNSDQPFFPEVPTGPNPDQTQPPPLPTNGSIPIPAATQAQPAKPTKKVAIAISVGIVTLGMLSALAFFLYRHRARHPGETQKLVGGSSQRLQDESRGPPSNFLYIGTVEPMNRRSVSEGNGANGSPYHKLNSVKRSDRYRPSPELQPLPPLTKLPSRDSRSPMSSSDEESPEGTFYTPQCSSFGNEEGSYTPGSRQSFPPNDLSATPSNADAQAITIPHSKRTSPKSRLSSSSPNTKHFANKKNPQLPPTPPPPPPPPPPLPGQHQSQTLYSQPIMPRRAKFSAPPPRPNLAFLQSNNTPNTPNVPTPPPPPPPPPPFPAPRKLESNYSTPSLLLPKQESQILKPKSTSTSKPIKEVTNGGSSSEWLEGDDTEGGKTKLKPLHWDKVSATSDRATVWDKLKSSSFALNEDMMESLFGRNPTFSAPKDATRKTVLPHVGQEIRVLDPKKSQNIAILLKALNVTRDEVSEALLDGNPEGLGADILETLVKMAPTKEEEIKLRDYSGDMSKLGSAERFLKAILDIPFAFKRVEAMLYRANFDPEIKYLRKSFQTLEAASEELKNSRLFFKLLEAVLTAGNRMNTGTNRGDARAFKLDTLLKLVDIKATDGKTTLLHFVVQEIIRSEVAKSDRPNENLENQTNFKMKDDDFKKQGLQVVSGLSRDLASVKKAAGMDSDVLSGYVLKLETGLGKVRSVLQYEKQNMQGRFFESMKLFLQEAEEEIVSVKGDETKALSLVKEVTEYFHGDTAKEEAHPLRIFMIVRDFLSVLDHVCREVGRMQDRIMVGSARSFRISSGASLPVLNRFNVPEESPSP